MAGSVSDRGRAGRGGEAEEAIDTLVRGFVEKVQNRHNLAALDDLFSPDMIDHSGLADPPNLHGTRAFFTMMFTAFPDMHFDTSLQLAEGDKVMTYKTFHGTHLGPSWAFPPPAGKWPSTTSTSWQSGTAKSWSTGPWPACSA